MRQPSWSALFARQSKTVARALQPLRARRTPPAGVGDWLAGVVVNASGLHHYRLFRPAGVKFGERLPLLVIHGEQDAVVSPRNAQAAVQRWSEAAGGAWSAAPRTVQRGRRHAMQLTDYRCHGHRVCTLAQVAQLGHAWSGGAAGEGFSDPQGPDASRMAWAFVAKCFAAAAAPTGADGSGLRCA